MHTNVDVVDASCLGEVLLEVLHVRYKELFLTCEVLVHLAVLIEDVNYYDFLGWHLSRFFEGVDVASLPNVRSLLWCITSTHITLHASASLLFLQVLGVQVLLLRWSYLLGRLLHALLVANGSGGRQTCECGLLVAEAVEDIGGGGLLPLRLLLLLLSLRPV